MPQTILVVEDQEDILDLLEYTLERDGYEVIACLDTANVQAILDEEDVDLIIMDRNLPGVEGTTFIKEIKTLGYTQPVIYLTAKDSTDDILDGFDAHADDYITKPFNNEELKARVKAVLKRTSNELEILKYKDIIYTKSNKSFTIDQKQIKLTHLEHDLLLEFLRNKDVLLSRETLLENVWPDSFDKQTKTVNVAIKRLKEKIDPDGSKNYINAVRGQGYILC